MPAQSLLKSLHPSAHPTTSAAPNFPLFHQTRFTGDQKPAPAAHLALNGQSVQPLESSAQLPFCASVNPLSVQSFLPVSSAIHYNSLLAVAAAFSATLELYVPTFPMFCMFILS